MLTGINALSLSLNDDFEGFGFGCISASNCCGKGKLNLLVAKCYCHLAVGNGECLVIYCPSNGNVLVVLRSGGKFNNGVLSYKFGNRESVLLSSNLFSRSLDNFYVVGERGNAHRNEVGVAGVENKNTGNVCLIAEVSQVICIDSSFIRAGVYAGFEVDLESGGEIANVCSKISLFFTEREVEVLRCILGHILSTDLNALNSYCKTYVVLKVSTCCELVSDIKSGNFLDSAVNDSKCTALGFLHAGVRLNNCSNGYGHTNLNTFSNGVLIKTVAVVTALALYVSEEEVVVLVICALTVHSNYDTLDNNGGTLFSCHVILKGYKNVLGNYSLVRNGCGCSVRSSDSTCKSVCVLFLCLLIYVDGPVGRSFNSLNEVVINSPCNHVLNSCNHYLTKNFIVSSGDVVFLLVHAIEVCNSRIKIVLFSGSLSCFFSSSLSSGLGSRSLSCFSSRSLSYFSSRLGSRSLSCFSSRLGSRSLSCFSGLFGCRYGGVFVWCLVSTSREEGYTHNYCQTECNKFFHNVSFYECFLYYYLIIISVGTKTFI